MIVRPHSRRWQPACAQRGRAISPHVGDVPLSEFTLDDADLVMANIPATKSTATRRQVAQVVRRVLGLAVYPARHIKENPIPRGWLPKVKRTKAFTYLYPEEDRALLACTGSLSEERARIGGPPLASSRAKGFVGKNLATCSGATSNSTEDTFCSIRTRPMILGAGRSIPVLRGPFRRGGSVTVQLRPQPTTSSSIPRTADGSTPSTWRTTSATTSDRRA